MFLYIEVAVRLRELRNFPFHLDLCRPFAAHWFVPLRFVSNSPVFVDVTLDNAYFTVKLSLCFILRHFRIR